MHVKSSAAAAFSAAVVAAGSVVLGTPTTAVGCPTPTSTARPGAPTPTSPAAPLPGPIENLPGIGKTVWWRGGDRRSTFLRAYWGRSECAGGYQVRITRLKLKLVRDGRKVKKEYTPFPQPWVERTGRRHQIKGPFAPGTRYRLQVRGVNAAGVGPTTVSEFEVPCRIVRLRCAVEGR